MKSIQNSIMDWLKHISDIAVAQKKIGSRYDNYWTDDILYWLAREGKARNLEVYSKLQGRKCGLDLCWIEKEDGILAKMPMALMCEWRPSPEIEYSFDRLIWTRAELRVMVLDATYPKDSAGTSVDWAKKQVQYLLSLSQRFGASQANDAYLFCVWCRDQGGSNWYFESVPSPEAE